jgi:hypothetical protein
MQISIDVKGLPELTHELAGETVQDLVRKITFGVEGRAKVSIQTSPASGKIYPRGKSGFHQASAPGEPPATDTGFLVNSIQAELNGPGDIGTIEVGSSYGLILEEARDRPFMMPAIDKVLSSL